MLPVLLPHPDHACSVALSQMTVHILDYGTLGYDGYASSVALSLMTVTRIRRYSELLRFHADRTVLARIFGSLPWIGTHTNSGSLLDGGTPDLRGSLFDDGTLRVRGSLLDDGTPRVARFTPRSTVLVFSMARSHSSVPHTYSGSLD